MRFDLAREQMRLHHTTAIQHRNGGLITRRFNPQGP
jgi:hypothetical protein